MKEFDPEENIQQVSEAWLKKFKVGQKEHGGNFAECPGLLRESQNEVLDLLSYLPCLRLQLEEVRRLVRVGKQDEALELLGKILS